MSIIKLRSPAVGTSDNKALHDALRSIYKVYGSDLSAFFHDAKDSHSDDRRDHKQKKVTARYSKAKKAFADSAS